MRFDRLLSVPAALGACQESRATELPTTVADERGLGEVARLAGLDTGRPFVCVHPGARLMSRRWPAERFAAVGRALVEAGFQVAVTGTAAERELVSGVVEGIGAGAVNLAGRTSLGEMAVLVGRASLLVSNDTGAVHIAAAVGTPAVVVASGSDVERWRPLRPPESRVLFALIECRPCAHEVCPIGHPCALAIEPRAVVEASLRVLRSRRGGTARERSVPALLRNAGTL